MVLIVIRSRFFRSHEIVYYTAETPELVCLHNPETPNSPSYDYPLQAFPPPSAAATPAAAAAAAATLAANCSASHNGSCCCCCAADLAGCVVRPAVAAKAAFTNNTSRAEGANGTANGTAVYHATPADFHPSAQGAGSRGGRRTCPPCYCSGDPLPPDARAALLTQVRFPHMQPPGMIGSRPSS